MVRAPIAELAAAKEDFKKRRRVGCEELFIAMIYTENPMTQRRNELAAVEWLTPALEDPAQEFHEREAMTESRPVLSTFSAPL